MELFCLANVSFLISLRRKKKLFAMEKILSEELAKYDDTIELKEEQRNALLYLVKILVIEISRTILIFIGLLDISVRDRNPQENYFYTTLYHGPIHSPL
jgi:hypothetical protein